MPARVPVRFCRPGAVLPARATAGSSGYDLVACLDAPVTIEPGARALVPTGVVLELPAGSEAQVRPRSGLAVKSGVTVLNAPGTIDADYRGEVQVILVNLGQSAFTVEPGMRIAQLVFARVAAPEVFAVDEVGATDRGAGGFGSTGK